MRYLYLSIILLLICNNSYAKNILEINWINKSDDLNIILTIYKKPNYKIFSLKNPNRLVIDFTNTYFDNVNYSKLLNNKIYFSNIRYAPSDKKNYRIVFDFNKNFEIKENFITEKKSHYEINILIKNDLKTIKNQNIIEEESPFSLIDDIKDQEDNIFSLIDKNSSNKSVKAIFSPIEKNKNPKNTVNKILNIKSPKKKEPAKKNKFIIMIDPGHGGTDPGAIGRKYRVREKDITLKYSLALKKLLEKESRYKIILTRDNDKFLSLPARRFMARKYKASIFISVHADSHPKKSVRGASIYTLSEHAYDKESKRLSIRENSADLLTNIDLRDEKKDIANMLIDLIRRDTSNLSAKFASLITNELHKDIIMLKGAHRFAGFRVLKGIDIPAVLIELGYLSNSQEEKLLISNSYKEKLVKSLKRAIDKHFDIIETQNE